MTRAAPFLAALALGCASLLSGDPRVVEPGDTLTIQLRGTAADEQREVVVQTDGRIVLDGIGEIDTTGLSTAQVAQQIEKRGAPVARVGLRPKPR